jgi:hypothetical protein
MSTWNSTTPSSISYYQKDTWAPNHTKSLWKQDYDFWSNYNHTSLIH